MKKFSKNIRHGFFLFVLAAGCLAPCVFCQDRPVNNDVNSLVKEGHRLAKDHKYNEAIQMFAKAKAADPKSALPDTALGMMFLKMGEYAEAERYLDSAEALEPDLAPVQYTLALLYEKQGKNQDAVNYWTKLLNNSQFKDAAKKHLEFLGVKK